MPEVLVTTWSRSAFEILEKHSKLSENPNSVTIWNQLLNSLHKQDNCSPDKIYLGCPGPKCCSVCGLYTYPCITGSCKRSAKSFTLSHDLLSCCISPAGCQCVLYEQYYELNAPLHTAICWHKTLLFPGPVLHCPFRFKLFLAEKGQCLQTVSGCCLQKS